MNATHALEWGRMGGGGRQVGETRFIHRIVLKAAAVGRNLEEMKAQASTSHKRTKGTRLRDSVFSDAVIKEGWLMKQSTGAFKRKQKRYFVVRYLLGIHFIFLNFLTSVHLYSA
jgi:hypothetical protein